MHSITLRQCGDCQLCCERLKYIQPASVRCEHQCESGCAIHSTKPAVCESFKCAWLQGLVDEYPLDIDCFFDVNETVANGHQIKALHAFGDMPPWMARDEHAKPGTVLVDESGQVFGSEHDRQVYKRPAEMVNLLRGMIKKVKGCQTS